MTKHNEELLKPTGVSRRGFLKTVLYTSPILFFDTDGLFAQGIKPLYKPKLVPKGQKIRVAQIGVFNRGDQVFKTFKNHEGSQLEFKAFADVAFTTPDYRMKGYPNIPCYRDYRQMFEEMHDQIDAVIIATPDFSHFPMVMHAMLLGKHVYVEKPLGQNVYENRLLQKTAAACGVVTQMGNQGHSDPGTFQFAEWVKAGVIKDVTRVDSWMANSRRWHGWTYKEYPETTPEPGYDWDQWLGRRPFRPHSPQLIDGNWRCWYEFGCGAMGDWGAHVLDAIHRYLKLGQPYEISTELMGPSDLIYPQGSVITFKFKAREGMPPLELKWYDGKDNVPKVSSDLGVNLGGVGSLTYTQDYAVLGRSHGALYQVVSKSKETALKNAGKLPDAPRKGSDHYKNFLNACQGIEPANSSFDVSASLAELLCLGCIGQRFGGTLQYDAQAMKITNNPKADAMLKGPKVRAGWDTYDRSQPAKSKKSQILVPEKTQWEDLFKDPSLSNWVNPYDYGEAKYVNGEVHLSSDKGKWFLLTKKDYTNFVFEAEIQMPVNAGNSGFLFRCLSAKNRAWGYQAEVDTADRKWSGGLYDEGRRMWFVSPNRDKAPSEEAKNKSIAEFRERAGECFKQGEWNKYRIVCIGAHIQIYVNGVLTTDTMDEWDISGPIGIQHHGEKGLVYKFRNLRIKDLGAGGEIYYPHREDAAKQAAQKAEQEGPKLSGEIYQAEDSKMQGCTVATNHTGYTGTGFVDFGDAGTSIEWTNIRAEKTGEFTLTFRYGATNNRPCDLFVNGKKVTQLAFKSTGEWTKWSTVDAKVSLQNGMNSVKLVAVGAGPNIDAMALN